MPRQTLPPQMKKFRSFEIMITQTKEEDVWAFLVSEMEKFAKKSKYYMSRIESLVEELKAENPYLQSSELNRISVHCWVDEEYHDFWKRYMILLKDIELCETAVWNEEDDEEKRDLIFEWTKAINTFNDNIRYNQFEIEYIEKKYHDEYTDMMKKKKQAKEEIKKEKERIYQEHLGHRNADKYVEQIENENYYVKFDGTRVFYDNTCSRCLVDKDAYFKYDYPTQKEIFEQKQRELQELESKKAKKVVQEQQKLDLPVLCCADCNYKTHYQSHLNEHNNSKEHQRIMRMKSLYCQFCNVQCRTDIEYAHHITTKRHKIANGEEQEDQKFFHCDKCNYTCKLKQHWDQHLASKKHNKAD